MNARAYSFEMSCKPTDVTYAIMEYKYFIVREVHIGDEPKGEYHIRILDNSNLVKAADFFRRELVGCEVDLVDRTGTLRLDYPVYAIAKDEMTKSGMVESFDRIDKILREHYD